MGCGSSKRTAVVPIGDSVGEVEASGGLTQCNSEVPAMERRDPQKEQPKEEGVRWSLNSGKREPIGLYWVTCNLFQYAILMKFQQTIEMCPSN